MWKNISFSRLSYVYAKETNFTLFHNIRTDTVFIKGTLLDGYFLTAITALLEIPQRVVGSFVSKRKNKFGCYAIKLFVNGEATEVVIDDLLPYDYSPEVDNWAFSHTKTDNEVYVLLLEKAFAKVFGSYEAMEQD